MFFLHMNGFLLFFRTAEEEFCDSQKAPNIWLCQGACKGSMIIKPILDTDAQSFYEKEQIDNCHHF